MKFRLAPLAAALCAPCLFTSPPAAAAPDATLAATVPASPATTPAEATDAPPPAAPAPLPTLVITSTPLTAPLTVETDLKQPRQPLPAHDGADYLKTVPGFAVTRKGGADGDPLFRGQGGSRLGLQADGQVLLGACNSRMDAPTAYLYPEAYDVLTVIKGPQTVLYGPVSPAGTALFTRADTRFGAPGQRVYASAAAASFGRRDLLLDARAGATAGYVAVQGSDSRADDYKDGDGVRVHSRYHRYNAGAALGWTPDADTLVELGAQQSDGEAAYADRAMDGTKFRRDAGRLRLERRHLSPLLDKLELTAYSGRVDHVMDDQELRAPGPMGYANVRRDTRGGRLAATLRPTPATELALGLDAQANAHASRSAPPGLPYGPLQDDADFRQVGAFAEGRLERDNGRRLVAGYRADRWQATDHRASIATGMMMPPSPNPSAGRTREDTLASGFARLEQPVAGTPLLAYAGLGHAERFPDYWELIARQGVASVSAFNLRPERTDQLDAGLLYEGGRLQASASLFAGRSIDYILVDYRSKSNGAARNIEATTWGGELGADVRVGAQWKLTSALSYVRGRNDSDARDLPQQPPLEGRLGLTFDNRRWSVGLLGRFVAAQDRYAVGEGNIVGKDLGRSAGFAVWSLNGGWRASRALLLSAGVDNLLDTPYAEFVSRSGGNGMGGAIPGYAPATRVNEPGRVAWLKASVEL